MQPPQRPAWETIKPRQTIKPYQHGQDVGQNKFAAGFPPIQAPSHMHRIASAPPFHYNTADVTDASNHQYSQEQQEGGSGSLHTRAQPAKEVSQELLNCLVQQAYTQMETDHRIVHWQQQAGVSMDMSAPTAPSELQHGGPSLVHAVGGETRLTHPAFQSHLSLSPRHVPHHADGTLVCDVVHEEEAYGEDVNWGGNEPVFESWHLMHLIQLLHSTTNNPWLASTLAYTAYISQNDLPAWIENVLHDYVQSFMFGANTREGFAVAWLASIIRCSVFSGPYPDLVGFTDWVHKLLSYFPNLACLLGMCLPASTLAAIKSQCKGMEPCSLDLLQPVGLHTHEQSRERAGREQTTLSHVDSKQRLGTQATAKRTPWKHYMCDWKEQWDTLAAERRPLLKHARQVWRQFEDKERAQEAAARAHMHALPHSHSIPGARASLNALGTTDTSDQDYCERCQEVAWMLRHLYEQQRDAYGWPGSPQKQSMPDEFDKSWGRMGLYKLQIPEHRCLDGPVTPVQVRFKTIVLSDS